ncbi:MAG: hypothetical protein JNL10_18330 [Verrucomicrobiales bacterium]|nr:hypothetical protein [Verrucomicrobiales bacterium]
MRWFRRLLALVSLPLALLSLNGDEFKLITGDVYRGTLSAADDDGIIVRLETGEFSPRIDWAKLSDETLRILLNNPRAKPFAEPLVEPVEIVPVKVKAKEIAVRGVTGRVPMPDGVKKGLLSALMTPNGLILVIALFIANLYAAFEVARFKWRPVGLVCGLSAVLPVVGWIIFLILPRTAVAEQENATEAAVTGTSVSVGSAAPSASEAPRGGAAAALGLSKTGGHGGGGGADGTPKVFKRGETTFNRRFFETQFPTFFRVVATEADRDLVIDVAAGKSSVVGSRVSRISASEIHFKTTTNQEIGVSFADITQVTLRHKDAA